MCSGMYTHSEWIDRVGTFEFEISICDRVRAQVKFDQTCMTSAMMVCQRIERSCPVHLSCLLPDGDTWMPNVLNHLAARMCLLDSSIELYDKRDQRTSIRCRIPDAIFDDMVRHTCKVTNNQATAFNAGESICRIGEARIFPPFYAYSTMVHDTVCKRKLEQKQRP